MPSNKIISLIVICFGIVFSVWLFTKDSNTDQLNTKSDPNAEVVPAIQTSENTNEDWKKILTDVDKRNPFTDLTSLTIENDDTTLTDQLSRDFMSQYLLLIKSGGKVNQETANILSQKTLSLPEYNQKPVVYIRQNLRIIQKNDLATHQKYKESINENMEYIYYSLNGDPLEIVINAINTESEVELKKLDPIISATNSILKYFLKMEVPERAVGVHLELTNAVSAILKDLEYMRVSLEDPVKIFIGVANYTENSTRFKLAIEKMDSFLK
jgi:hypothetical protein